jgi:quinol-cytochrome oxidoreductase complex cytochrome b subunit
MYGQFSNPFASAAKWIFIGFAIIIVMAFIIGADIKNSTWFNPDIATAQAKQLQIETAHQQATYQLQERLATAQTEAEIQKIQLDQKMLDAQYEHDIQVLAQDLEHRQIAFKTWMTVLTIIGTAISIAIVAATIILTINWASHHPRSTSTAVSSTPARPKPSVTFKPVTVVKEEGDDDPVKKYWQGQRQLAQEKERQARQMEARMSAAINPTSMTKEQYSQLSHVE